MIYPRLTSPTERVSLEAPAVRARRLARVQSALIVIVSMAALLLSMIAVSLPVDDRTMLIAVLAVVVTLGGVVVGATDYWIGVSLVDLVQNGSKLRQSAAERAADLARANAELRRRDRERASLFATMSHELRTPLNAIIGFSRVLLDDVDGPLNEEQRADVTQIHDGGNGLLSIVNGTLDLARLDAGAVALSRGPTELWTVAEEVVALLRPLAVARGLDLTSSIGPGLPPVDADEQRLRQVLVNLVGNAVKFTDAGRVSLSAAFVDGRVTVAVRDTGIGISRPAQELIFEPFRQADAGVSRRHGGTGLGLAITRRLVQLMDGRIWVESEPGTGSTFYVTLAPADQSVSDAAPDGADVPTHHVTVVGDEQRCAPFVTALTAQGTSTLSVSGPRWRHRVSAARSPLVLVDAFGTRAGAWRALAELRAHPGPDSRRVGFVGVGSGVGALLLTDDLDVLLASDLEVTLPSRLDALLDARAGDPRTAHGPVLVVGADAGWRRRVTLLVEGTGFKTVEAIGAAEAIALARRMPVRGLVTDLLVSDPGILRLVADLRDDERLRCLPVVVVGPAGLAPSEQLDLYLGAADWLSTRASSVSQLADDVKRAIAESEREASAAGVVRWRER